MKGAYNTPTSAFARFSPLRHSAGFDTWTNWHMVVHPSPMCQEPSRDPFGAGILTCFPFEAFVLRDPLGPTNPRLTNIAEEPWPLRRCGFSRALCCYSSRDSHPNAVHRSSRPDFFPRTAPLCQITLRCSAVSVADLAPSIFGARVLGW